MIARWEARCGLRYGSEHRGWFETQDEAVAFAQSEIAKAGNVGCITFNDTHSRIIYFDVHGDME